MTTVGVRACPQDHGPVVGGRYDVGALLTTGDGHCVHEGRDDTLRRPVLITLATGGDGPPDADRLPLPPSARLGRGPGLGEVFDGGRDHDTLWLVTQRPEGSTLAEELATGPLPADEVRDLGARVARALAPLHRAGTAHGAVGPDVVTRGPAGVVVGGVGTREWIARWAGIETAPPFPAPELVDGGSPGPPADVYALGRTLAAAGPWPGDPALRCLVREMTRRDPTARPDVETVLLRLVHPTPDPRPSGRRVALASALITLVGAATLAVAGPRLAVGHDGAGNATLGPGQAVIIAPVEALLPDLPDLAPALVPAFEHVPEPASEPASGTPEPHPTRIAPVRASHPSVASRSAAPTSAATRSAAPSRTRSHASAPVAAPTAESTPTAPTTTTPADATTSVRTSTRTSTRTPVPSDTRSVEPAPSPLPGIVGRRGRAAAPPVVPPRPTRPRTPVSTTTSRPAASSASAEHAQSTSGSRASRVSRALGGER